MKSKQKRRQTLGLGGLMAATGLVLILLTGCGSGHKLSPGAGLSWSTVGVSRSDFGRTRSGEAVSLYTLQNTHGVTVKIMTYGATVTEVDTPDRNGKVANIVLGFDSLAEYEKSSPYFGATVGRYANRIANGKFSLEGKDYTLAVNNGSTSLHGGKVGFDKVVWDATAVTYTSLASTPEPAIRFTHVSPDMDEGYPGKLSVEVVFHLTEKDALQIVYKATTTKPTVVNLTNHSYWNLSGFSSPTVLDHLLMIDADQFTPINDAQVPTGKLKSVAGGPMDFLRLAAIGARIDQVAGGYDFNYVLNHSGTSGPVAARVADPTTGRVLEMRTTEPGVQFYTGNYLDGTLKGIGGQVYAKHAGLCLEAQHFPDSPNEPDFPTTELKPGQTYTQTTTYQFSAR